MVRAEHSVVEELVRELDISLDEASLYLKALKDKVLETDPGDRNQKALVGSLQARGMLILASNGLHYLPVHPRLAVSNLFRALEDKLVRKRREKRLAADRLTLELIAIQEDAKDTNSTRGGVKRR